MRRPILILLLSVGALTAEEASVEVRDAGVRHASRHPMYREIDGAFFDITSVAAYYDPSTGLYDNPMRDWELILGKVLSVTEGGLIISTYGLGGRYLQAERIVYLKRYPAQESITDDRLVACFAYRLGRTNYITVTGASRTVELWDFGGKPSDQRVAEHLASLKLLEEEKKAARLKALDAAEKRRRELQDLKTRREVEALQRNATTGEGFAQFALGMRYLTGRGVETNQALAIQWLRAATTNGHAQASNELARIEGNGR